MLMSTVSSCACQRWRLRRVRHRCVTSRRCRDTRHHHSCRPGVSLNANWAYMTMASLAWSIKAWCALLLPVSPRWAGRHNEQRRRLLTMEFRTFRRAFITSPARSSGPPAASAGEFRPGTHGWGCSSASSTPSDADHPGAAQPRAVTGSAPATSQHRLTARTGRQTSPAGINEPSTTTTDGCPPAEPPKPLIQNVPATGIRLF